MVALSEENWVQQHKIEFDGYFILGLPSAFASERVSPDHKVAIEPTVVGVQKVDEGPEGIEPTMHPRFIGKVGERIEDMRGMSGGPIFGVSTTSESTRYWIVGLQSSWHRPTRTVFGCPLPEFASLVSAAFKEHLPEAAE